MARDPRPQTNKPVTTPPEPGTYQFVVRRRDRTVWPWRVAVSYKRTAVAYGITTPWDGITAPTLFLENEAERRAAYRLGWREDITAQWMRHLDDAPEPEPELTVESVKGLKFADLRRHLKDRGLSAAGKTGELRARLVAALELEAQSAGEVPVPDPNAKPQATGDTDTDTDTDGDGDQPEAEGAETADPE